MIPTLKNKRGGMESRNQWMPDVVEVEVVAAEDTHHQWWRWVLLGAFVAILYLGMCENSVLSDLSGRYSRLNARYIDGSMFPARVLNE